MLTLHKIHLIFIILHEDVAALTAAQAAQTSSDRLNGQEMMGVRGGSEDILHCKHLPCFSVYPNNPYGGEKMDKILTLFCILKLYNTDLRHIYRPRGWGQLLVQSFICRGRSRVML